MCASGSLLLHKMYGQSPRKDEGIMVKEVCKFRDEGIELVGRPVRELILAFQVFWGLLKGDCIVFHLFLSI